MVGGVLPPAGDNTYLLREGSGRGQNWLLGLRPQCSSYCRGCHSVTRMLRQGRVFLVIIGFTKADFFSMTKLREALGTAVLKYAIALKELKNIFIFNLKLFYFNP
ncbi:hypothetical protein AVEN_72251-1 [Araneus ventricosus]|uniref:Uncharacterized protein n=1 Tax=Araneus ventricosus TaxID=182803 RepID=A0A4Y2GU70_ARAVE|nr:hypothetical protein AVEN_72251-1 [Araneus ventricosus]